MSRIPLQFVFALAAAFLPVGVAFAADEADDRGAGAALYRQKCAVCHGDRGQGSEQHEARLEGDRSIAQLADLIQRTMPEDAPGSLSASEAESVAQYIHAAFYSPIARARYKPARIETSRLTIRQYRLALMDLLSPAAPPASGARGLRGEYFQGRRFSGRERKAERIDPQVNFDFGVGTPAEEVTEPSSFSIRWQGSVRAPDTGEYQLVVRTEHAARLWLNDTGTPLIDAWVKSGDQTEYEASLFLVAGRSYPLRLEFSKAKQGVDDSDKRRGPPPERPASIRLLWKRPQSDAVLEPIASRFLSTAAAAELYVCATPFPPDDRSTGWIRGTAVSKTWDAATTAAALDAARHVADRIDVLAGTRPDAADRDARIRAWCARLASRAFRRPLTESQQQVYVDRQFAAGLPLEESLKRFVLLVLKSPRFLFRELQNTSDPYLVAERLAFGLWDSIPDERLWDAARSNQLETAEQVREQARRMVQDPRAHAKVHHFLLTWVHADQARELAKDRERFTSYDAQVRADLRSSLELQLNDVLESETADFRNLILADEVYLSPLLASFFGAEPAEPSEFGKVRLDGGHRAGVLTHPYLLAAFADERESSPIHRGVFLARGILGQTLRPPPVAVAPLAPDLHPQLTTRERVTLQTKAPTCMTCHGIINPLGFALEHFDAVGRLRTSEQGKPIDSRGFYQSRDGRRVTVDGARELAEYVARSAEAHEAFVEQMFHHLVQQPVLAFGPRVRGRLTDEFRRSELDIRRLAIEIMTATATANRGDDVASNQHNSP